jgi:hypothetical protein
MQRRLSSDYTTVVAVAMCCYYKCSYGIINDTSYTMADNPEITYCSCLLLFVLRYMPVALVYIQSVSYLPH